MISKKLILTSTILSCIILGCKNNSKKNENNTLSKEQKYEKISSTWILKLAAYYLKTYSNTNYVLLAKILEQITKSSVKHEITTRIIKPLKLARTFYIEHLVKTELPLELYKDFAHGVFKKIDGILENDVTVDGYNISLSSGAGGGTMVSTTEELNIYIQNCSLENYWPHKNEKN